MATAHGPKTGRGNREQEILPLTQSLTVHVRVPDMGEPGTHYPLPDASCRTDRCQGGQILRSDQRRPDMTRPRDNRSLRVTRAALFLPTRSARAALWHDTPDGPTDMRPGSPPGSPGGALVHVRPPKATTMGGVNGRLAFGQNKWKAVICTVEFVMVSR